MRRFDQGLAKADAFCETAWLDENFWVGHHADDAAENLARDAVT
jgi:hypothetical protein